jgi:predicted DsbA family dithiol-disulfide isomerase
MSAPSLTIDFVSDFSCPWCYVAWRALDRAIATRPDLTVERCWAPFLLRPDTPPEGLDRVAYIEKIFANQPERARASRAALQAAADDADAPLRLDAARTLPNTMNAHRLTEWALGQSRLAAMVDALFAAYFVQGLDIGRDEVLVDIAGEVGLDRELVAELLKGDDDWTRVADAHNSAVNAGIGGVPVVIFDQKFARQGAESVASYARYLEAASV